MLDIQNLLGAFSSSSSRHRASSHPPPQNRFSERTSGGAMPSYSQQTNMGGESGNGGGGNTSVLPPFPPSMNRPSRGGGGGSHSIPPHQQGIHSQVPSGINNINMAGMVSGNTSYYSSPPSIAVHHCMPTTTMHNNNKLYSTSQGGGGYNVTTHPNMSQLIHPNSLYPSHRFNPQFFSPMPPQPYQNFVMPNGYLTPSGASAIAGGNVGMQQSIHDYLSMTYGGGGRGIGVGSFNHLPISRTIQVNRSELLPMRLIGDVVMKNINLGHFLSEGGAIRFYLLGEQIRHDYKALSISEWEAEKNFLKETTQIPVHKPPVLLHDNVTLYETISILRYLSKKMGQYGCDHLKDFVMDAVSASLMDWRAILDKAIFANIEEAEDSRNSFSTYLNERDEWYGKFEELLDSYIKKMREMQIQQIIEKEEILDMRKGEDEKFNYLKECDKFFTGKKPAFCDYILFSILYDDLKLLQDIKKRKDKEDERRKKEERLIQEEEEVENEDGRKSKREERRRKRRVDNDDDEDEVDDESENNFQVLPPNFLAQCPRLLAVYDELKFHPHIEQFIAQIDEANKINTSENDINKSSNDSVNNSMNNLNNNSYSSEDENNENENIHINTVNNNHINNNLQNTIQTNPLSSVFSYNQNINNNFISNTNCISNGNIKTNINHVYNQDYINSMNKQSTSPPLIPPQMSMQKMMTGGGVGGVCTPPLPHDALSMTYGGGGGINNYFYTIPHISYRHAPSFSHSSSTKQHMHENTPIPTFSHIQTNNNNNNNVPITYAYAHSNPHEMMSVNNYNNNISAFHSKRGTGGIGMYIQQQNSANTKLEEHQNAAVITTTASTAHADDNLADQIH